MAEASITEDKIKMQFGDIIEIEAPSDDNMNLKKYYIKFIDPTRIVLVAEDGTETELVIKEDGSLRNEAIIGINIINRAEDPGYAKQNDLLPGAWINIFFDDGDIPIVITGKITNLEEDQIEITTYEDNEVIYIDFAYKGLPEDIPITKIVLREAPIKEKKVLMETVMLDAPVSDVSDAPDAPAPDALAPDADTASPIIEGVAEEEGAVNIPVQPEEFKERVKDLFLNADQIQIGQSLGDVTQVIDIPEAEQRFGIEKQTNDLLDELLSTIPNSQRTRAVLNNIHTMIERFKQLRNEFSLFDQQGNALKQEIQGSNFKPLVNSLKKLNHKLYWILPVVRNKKKVYDTDVDIQEELLDIVPLTLAETRIEEENIIKTYKWR